MMGVIVAVLVFGLRGCEHVMMIMLMLMIMRMVVVVMMMGMMVVVIGYVIR